MAEHVQRGNLGIHAKLLWQVAEDAADFVFLPQHIDTIEVDRAGVRILQRGDGPHQGTLAGAIGPDQAKHAVSDGQGQVLKCLYSIWIGLGETCDRERHCYLRVSRNTRIGPGQLPQSKMGSHSTTRRLAHDTQLSSR
jgi:hypothetical protein